MTDQTPSLSELKSKLRMLMSEHGARSLLATIVELLSEYKTDDIDENLIKTLDLAGKTYAREMGLQWWAETSVAAKQVVSKEFFANISKYLDEDSPIEVVDDDGQMKFGIV